MNEQQTAEMLHRLKTELERRTEIAEAMTARAEVTLQQVSNLRVALFQMQTAMHELKRAAGIAKT